MSSPRISGNIDYTYSISEGNASDPAAAFNDEASNIEPEKMLVPLDWDQRHTFNTTLTYHPLKNSGVGIIFSYGSGLPYTTQYLGVRTSFENNARKPSTYNIDFIITRSANNYGDRQYEEKLISKSITSLKENKKIPIHGDGSYIRDWTYVKDNVSGILAIIDGQIKNEIRAVKSVGGKIKITNEATYSSSKIYNSYSDHFTY